MVKTFTVEKYQTLLGVKRFMTESGFFCTFNIIFKNYQTSFLNCWFYFMPIFMLCRGRTRFLWGIFFIRKLWRIPILVLECNLGWSCLCAIFNSCANDPIMPTNWFMICFLFWSITPFHFIAYCSNDYEINLVRYTDQMKKNQTRIALGLASRMSVWKNTNKKAIWVRCGFGGHTESISLSGTFSGGNEIVLPCLTSLGSQHAPAPCRGTQHLPCYLLQHFLSRGTGWSECLKWNVFPQFL